MFWRKRQCEFNVTLALGGRHPYLRSKRLDFEDATVTVLVLARDWNDAEQQAFRAQIDRESWTRKVVAISRARH